MDVKRLLACIAISTLKFMFILIVGLAAGVIILWFFHPMSRFVLLIILVVISIVVMTISEYSK